MDDEKIAIMIRGAITANGNHFITFNSREVDSFEEGWDELSSSLKNEWRKLARLMIKGVLPVIAHEYLYGLGKKGNQV